jgi:hypothetical protein
MKTVRRTFVDETNRGVYLWRMPDGKFVADDEGNFLSINAIRGDQKRIDNITAAAKSLGITEGEAVFLSGPYKVSDEEYEYQKSRLAMGITPDPLDLPAIREEQEWIKKHGRK